MLGGILADVIGIRLTFAVFGIIIFLSTFLMKGRESLSAGRKAGEQGKRLENKDDVKVLIFLGLSVFMIVLVDQMLTNLTGRIVVDRIIPSLPVTLGAASLTGVLVGSRHFITFIAPVIGWICRQDREKKSFTVFHPDRSCCYLLFLLLLRHGIFCCCLFFHII